MIFWSNQCVFQVGKNVDVICCLKGHIDSEYFLLPVGYSCQYGCISLLFVVQILFLFIMGLN